MKKYLLQLMLVSLLCLIARTTITVKIYPLGQDYFQKIYLVHQNEKEYYLTISCRDKNLLSISLTTEREFDQAPAFNIYGNQQVQPKMGKGMYTFLKECEVEVEVNPSTLLKVKRRDGAEVFVLDNISIQDKHTQFTVYDDSVKWGLGERFQQNFHVADGRWTIWNRDKPWKVDQGKEESSDQTYGHHPIYLARESKSKLYHLTYFKNTNGLRIDSTKNSSEMVFHSIGGPLHFIIILGQQNPEEVLERYHSYIGESHIPPFWSFGHHQCRWGYKNLSDIQNAVKGYNQNDIPLDAVWSDLEYMKEKMIFTINEKTHPSKEMNTFIRDEQLHFVPLLDVGISIGDTVGIKTGENLDIFLKHPKNADQTYSGEVWPGIVFFVDFLHPNATQYWKKQLTRFYLQLNFSGIWLDMNEPSNFKGGQWVQQTFKIQPKEPLNTMTISSELKHYNHKNPSQGIQHKEVHAYYGHLSTVPTYQFLSEQGRAFIISRSTSVGTGHFAGHWTGDNVATWEFLRLSISGNFLFQIFGIHMVGADICGFYQHTTEELCSRWHQVGAFYPFARNHNHNQARSQEPFAFGAMLLETSKSSIKTRYSLLKQLYTIFLQKKGKGSYYRPLTFEFYKDELAYQKQAIQTQVLIGHSLMTAPIVYPGYSQREVYFPGEGESWYRFEINTQTGEVKPQQIAKYEGKTKQVIVNPLPSAPPLFLRGGYLLFTNYPQNRSVKLNNVFSIFAVLKNNSATGSILGISNYNEEPHIQKCIDQNCLYEISLKKIGDQTFILEWKYKGDSSIIAPLKIKSFLIVDADKRWRTTEMVPIDKPTGVTSIQAPKLM